MKLVRPAIVDVIANYTKFKSELRVLFSSFPTVQSPRHFSHHPHGGLLVHFTPIITILVVKYSSIPYLLPSRPKPLSLMPPNGAAGSLITPRSSQREGTSRQRQTPSILARGGL